jgi:RNA polymerase sigma-70 factor, ECF subfamily
MSSAMLSVVTTEQTSEEFDQIFRENYQLVYRTAYGVTGSSEDAEDVLQTIFLRLVRRDLPPALLRNPKAYLYRAAVNLSLNTIRLRHRQVLTDDFERFEAVGQSAEAESAEDLHKRLYAAIAELDPEAAQILILRYVHNYSDAAIAKMLGKSRTVIAVRLFRSRARLRKLIRGPYGDKS